MTYILGAEHRFRSVARPSMATVVKGLALGTALLLAACGGSRTPDSPVQSVYYVDPAKGDDSNSGTSLNAPFKTLAPACTAVSLSTQAVDGDVTIYLRGGEYVLSSPLAMGPGLSGQHGHQVVFSAMPGESPTLSGGRRVGGWSLHDPVLNIWQAPLNVDNVRQLYVNASRAVRAHQGSGLPGAVMTATGYTTTDSTMQEWGNLQDVEFVYNALLGGTGGSLFTERRCLVASIQGNVITMASPAWGQCADGADIGEGISYPTDIENAYELLSAPGEWYFDRTRKMIYYIPRPGEDPSTSDFVVPLLENLVTLAGTPANPVHDIRFEGITFAYATWFGVGQLGGFSEFQANYSLSTGSVPGNIVVRAGRDITFNQCVFQHLGGIGLDAAGASQRVNVLWCEFTDISANCIKLGAVDDPLETDPNLLDVQSQVQNCFIHDAPSEYHGGVAIFCGYVSNVNISHNYILNTPYTAISCGWGWATPDNMQDNVFNNNHIANFCLQLGDGGGIYTMGPMPGSEIKGNWIHGMPARVSGGALYPDEGTSNIPIQSNVCSDLGSSWVFIHTGSIQNIVITGNYASTAQLQNVGTNCVITNQTTVTGGNWPAPALAIMSAAGPGLLTLKK